LINQVQSLLSGFSDNFMNRLGGVIDNKVLKEHPEKQEEFDEEITRFVNEQNPSYPDLADHIVGQYKKFASRNIDERQDWFQEKNVIIEEQRRGMMHNMNLPRRPPRQPKRRKAPKRRKRKEKKRENGKASLLENIRMKISQCPPKKHERSAGKLKKDSQDTTCPI
jgi:hypothetical protein